MNCATIHFNHPDVQEALDANVTKISYPLLLRNREVGNAWKDDSTVSIVPLIKKLVEEGIRIWIFSRDMDGRVPGTSTRCILKKLGLDKRT
ncbi:hypothetical protein CUMW_100510 [Citrus unshiu]|nr:hypothetical protein CUMW_100510 [Citrus unshiu]